MIPRVSRPNVPDGYLLDSEEYVHWDTVEERLEQAIHYWLSTSTPDGRPHVVPRWGVWLRGRFWYDGSPDTRHVRNLHTNPWCALHLEDGEAATIVYGNSEHSEPVTGSFGQELSDEFGRKYGADYTPGPDAWSDETAGGLRLIKPARVLAWSTFPQDATRFEFD